VAEGEKRGVANPVNQLVGPSWRS